MGAGFSRHQQMAGAFQLLRSNDLIWSRMRARLSDGRAAHDERSDGLERRRDADALQDAFEYLRQAVPEQRFADGRYHVDGRPVGRADIRAPIFVVGTERDHVAPWRSVHKITLSRRPSDLRADHRRAQCRDRLRAGSCRSFLQNHDAAAAQWLSRSRRLERGGGKPRGVLVDGLGSSGSARIPRHRSRHRRWAMRTLAIRR